MKLRIHTKLTFAYFGLWLVVLLILFFYLNHTLPQLLRQEIALDLRRNLKLTVWTLGEKFPEGFSSFEADPEADAISEQLGVRVTLIAKDGKVFGDSDLEGESLRTVENHQGRPEVQQALTTGFGQGIRYSQTVKNWLLYEAAPLGKSGSVVRLALPLSKIELALFHLKKILAVAILLSIIASFILGYLVSLKISKPIREIVSVSEEIAKGDYSKRIRHSSKDEIGDLASAFNQMAEEVEADLQKIEEERKRLQAILFGMVEGVMATDGSGKVILVNPAFQELFGLKESPIGKTPLEALRNRGVQEVVEEASRKRATLVEKEITLSAAHEKTFLVHAMGLLEEERLKGIVCVFHDVTNLKRLENLRREFVANVSHELKTPLTSIHGYTETLLEGAIQDPSHAKEFTQIIYEQSERLSRLIDDLLDLSKIESGRIELRPERVEMKTLIAQALRDMASRAEKKRLTLETQIPDALAVNADPAKVHQILMNLLDNAVKYTPEGGTVRIGATFSGGSVEINIQDTGIGIPERDLPHLFERFYRVDKSRSRELGGTGLGLAIVKHLVQAHGGKVWVESTLGKGSTFYCTLPASPFSAS